MHLLGAAHGVGRLQVKSEPFNSLKSTDSLVLVGDGSSWTDLQSKQLSQQRVGG